MTSAADVVYYRTMLQFNYHQDPGHGWMEISKEEFQKLPLTIRLNVSRYSYVGVRGAVYLEEDCDMPLVLEHYKEEGVEVQLNEVNHPGEANIRNLRSYTLV